MKTLLNKMNSGMFYLEKKINHIQFLTGNSLKIIAILSMVIDHICKIVLQWLLSNYWWIMADNGKMSLEQVYKIDNFIRFDLQSTGTIAFPLFWFARHGRALTGVSRVFCKLLSACQ